MAPKAATKRSAQEEPETAPLAKRRSTATTDAAELPLPLGSVGVTPDEEGITQPVTPPPPPPPTEPPPAPAARSFMSAVATAAAASGTESQGAALLSAAAATFREGSDSAVGNSESPSGEGGGSRNGGGDTAERGIAALVAALRVATRVNVGIARANGSADNGTSASSSDGSSRASEGAGDSTPAEAVPSSSTRRVVPREAVMEAWASLRTLRTHLAEVTAALGMAETTSMVTNAGVAGRTRADAQQEDRDAGVVERRMTHLLTASGISAPRRHGPTTFHVEARPGGEDAFHTSIESTIHGLETILASRGTAVGGAGGAPTGSAGAEQAPRAISFFMSGNGVADREGRSIRGAPLALLELLSALMPNKGIDEAVIDAKTSTSTFAGSSSGGSKDASTSEHRRCTICLEDFVTGDELRFLPCFHFYHRGCIDPWLTTDRHCPVCKFDVST
eukprot:TRINITY_DN8461_c0_g1_i1.p1 TRINITY_DN8461_c0_g1~~TRINITY_DN8461_c0_g1_i1.p1  ORF type:complete len:465 (-),score=102.09 TRINITY_DN8461_c0_g1_i1:163-1509(-)